MNTCFELKLTEINVTSASIPVSWCLDPEWLKDHKHELDDWLLYFVTFNKRINGRSTEQYSWAKVSDAMAFVKFNSAGENRILAFLSPRPTIKYHTDLYTCSWGRIFTDPNIYYPFDIKSEQDPYSKDRLYLPYSEKIPFTYKNLSLNNNQPRSIIPFNYLDVNIPKECFAKIPWDHKWVNYFFSEDPPQDQCQYRKRRIFAYTIQPFFYFGWMILNSLAAIIAFLFGFFYMGFLKQILNPKGYYDFPIEWTDSYFYSYKHTPVLGRISIITPSFLGLSTIALWLLGANLFLVFGLITVVNITILIGWGITKTLIPFLNKNKIISELMSKFIIWIDKKEEKRIKKSEEIRERMIGEWENYFSCNNYRQIKTIKELPKSSKSIKLRYEALKGSVCKPFAK